MKNIKNYNVFGAFYTQAGWVDIAGAELVQALKKGIDEGVVYVQEGTMQQVPFFITKRAGFVEVAPGGDIMFNEPISGLGHIVATNNQDVMRNCKAIIEDGEIIQLYWYCMSVPYHARFFKQTGVKSK